MLSLLTIHCQTVDSCPPGVEQKHIAPYTGKQGPHGVHGSCMPLCGIFPGGRLWRIDLGRTIGHEFCSDLSPVFFPHWFFTSLPYGCCGGWVWRLSGLFRRLPPNRSDCRLCSLWRFGEESGASCFYLSSADSQPDGNIGSRLLCLAPCSLRPLPFWSCCRSRVTPLGADGNPRLCLRRFWSMAHGVSAQGWCSKFCQTGSAGLMSRRPDGPVVA